MEIIPRDKRVFDTALEICRLVKDRGGRVYMVGGSVRDALLGHAVSEYDMEVYGIPAAELFQLAKDNFSVSLVGKAFGVIKLNKFPIDLSLPRKEVKTGVKHNEFLVSSDESMAPEEACKRRDFTINALMFDPLDGSLLDPLGGAADMERKILRHCSEQFSEDPLRALRGMKFCGIFQLTPAEETRQLIEGMELNHLPKSRIFEEWRQTMVRSTKPSMALEYLSAAGLLRYYPELERLRGCPQDPRFHPEGDVWQHTALCMDAFVRFRPDDEKDAAVCGLAVLCHDMGKPDTTVHEPDGRITSKRHELYSETRANEFLERITEHRHYLSTVPPLVRYHMVPYQLFINDNPLASVRRLALRTGSLRLMAVVVSSDHNGRGEPFLAEVPEAKYLTDKAEELKLIDSRPKPIVLGRHLVESGLTPGRHFREILDNCFNAQLSGVFGDLESGKKYLASLLANNVEFNHSSEESG